MGGCQISLKKSVTKMYDSTLLALRGGVGGGVKFPEKKRYITLEWPLRKPVSSITKQDLTWNSHGNRTMPHN